MDPNSMAMREFIYSKIDMNDVQSVLDIGCGRGYDLKNIGDKLPHDARLVGLDSMSDAIEAANSWTRGDSRFSFLAKDVSTGIPFADQSFDLIFSNNLLECIVDKEALIKDVHRVLKPEGQVIVAHFDWDSQLFDGQDKALVRKIVQRFNDWRQDWMADCDAWMGRRLWRTFNKSGLFKGEIYPYVLTNTEFAEPCYGYQVANDCEALVRQGLILEEEYNRFYRDLSELAEEDAYFYCITMYIFVGRKL